MHPLSTALLVTAAVAATPGEPTDAKKPAYVPKKTFKSEPSEIFVPPRALRSGRRGWRVVDYRTGGVSRVDRSQLDPNGKPGALEQVLPEPGGSNVSSEIEILSPDTMLDPEDGLRPTRDGFGKLSDLQTIGLSWYRDGTSTAPPWFVSALRVYVFDPDLGVRGTSYVMVWEAIYNGYAPAPDQSVPTDTWVRSDVTQDFFWRTPLFIDGLRAPAAFCSENPTECFVFNRTLSDWDFGPRAVIFGMSIAVGSGWNGSYRGFVDDVTLAFTHGRKNWNFGRRRRWQYR